MRDPKILEEVKQSLALLTELSPGRAIEVRIPPYAAVQCGDGPKHTRGTPPNVIELDAETLVALAVGTESWDAATGRGSVHASGTRATLADLLPLPGLSE